MSFRGILLAATGAAWLTVSATEAKAYVTYNRLGYVSCTACHFDSTGAGLLTPYGRSVEAAMSAFPSETAPPEQKIYGGLQARALGLTSSTAANPFLMQADLLGTAFITQSTHVDAIVGPNLQEGQSSFVTIPSGWDGIVLRRGLVSSQITDLSTIEVGRDEAVAGLNIDDHTSFLRMDNRRGIYDYPTQARYVYQSDQWQLLPYLMAPSYEEAADNQEYGGGFRSEYLLNSSNSVGTTALFGNSPAITRVAASAFMRLSHDHWNGLAGEAVFTHRTVHASQTGFDQQDVYLRPYVAIPEWIETSVVYEYLHDSDPYYNEGFQYGPEINIRLHEYLSVIGDGRNLGIQGNAQWSWYAQLFLHVQI